MAASAGGIDPDVVEAAALAHDLGHPPFGHVAEEVLDEHCRRNLSEGFNGNAQSFRILTKLAIRRPDFAGLNLTRATLNVSLKYPCLYGGKFGEKSCASCWGAYKSESADFAWVRTGRHTDGPRSVEAEIVDWADDVAYAVHDLEDFYRAGLIPLDRLTRNDGDNDDVDLFVSKAATHFGGRYSVHQVRTTFSEVLGEFAPVSEPYQGRQFQRADLRSITSNLIGRYISALTVELPGENRPLARRDPGLELEVEVLKQLTWQYVIFNSALATQQNGHRYVIRTLVCEFAHKTRRSEEWYAFPPGYQDQLREIDEGRSPDLVGLPFDVATRRAAKERVAVDYIASMTENQAIDMYRRIRGVSLGSALDPIVP